MSILSDVFTYDAQTGYLFWKADRIKVRRGQRAGWKSSRGYRYVYVDGACQKEHRIIWALVTGEWPPNDVDHINRVRDDNRWKNLRLASRSQNCGNSNLRKDNQYGVKGVTWLESRKKWKARITFEGKDYSLGYYVALADAVAAYDSAAERIFGDFARLNRGAA